MNSEQLLKVISIEELVQLDLTPEYGCANDSSTEIFCTWILENSISI